MRPSSRSSVCTEPSITASGVRSSCDTAATKSLFWRFRSTWRARATRELLVQQRVRDDERGVVRERGERLDPALRARRWRRRRAARRARRDPSSLVHRRHHDRTARRRRRMRAISGRGDDVDLAVPAYRAAKPSAGRDRRRARRAIRPSSSASAPTTRRRRRSRSTAPRSRCRAPAPRPRATASASSSATRLAVRADDSYSRSNRRCSSRCATAYSALSATAAAIGTSSSSDERTVLDEVERDEADRRGRQRREQARSTRSGRTRRETRLLDDREHSGGRHDVEEREAQRRGERGAPRGHVVHRGVAEGLRTRSAAIVTATSRFADVERDLEPPVALRDHVHAFADRGRDRETDRADDEEADDEHGFGEREREPVPVELERHVEGAGRRERASQAEDRDAEPIRSAIVPRRARRSPRPATSCTPMTSPTRRSSRFGRRAAATALIPSSATATRRPSSASPSSGSRSSGCRPVQRSSSGSPPICVAVQRVAVQRAAVQRDAVQACRVQRVAVHGIPSSGPRPRPSNATGKCCHQSGARPALSAASRSTSGAPIAARDRAVDQRALDVVGGGVAVVRRGAPRPRPRRPRCSSTCRCRGSRCRRRDPRGVARRSSSPAPAATRPRRRAPTTSGFAYAEESFAARPGGNGVVARRRGARRVGRADGDDVRVVARRRDAARAVVAGRDHDRDARRPRGFDRRRRAG